MPELNSTTLTIAVHSVKQIYDMSGMNTNTPIINTSQADFGSSEQQIPTSLNIYDAASMIRNIFLPIIVMVGLTGNTISIVVFLSTHMKQSSATAFLSTLALVDNIFLTVLFITWFDGSISNILKSEGTCQLLIYVTYVTSFLSVWYVVGFTTERYMAICHPLRAPFLCTQFREKIAVIVLALIGCLLYNFALWTTSVIEINGIYRCGHKIEFIDLLEKVTWADTAITMLIPFILILSMNLKVVCKAAQFHHKRKQCLQPSEFGSHRIRNSLRSKPQMRVTRTLMLVSTTFLVLNLPSHVLRLYTLFAYSSDTGKETHEIQMYRYVVQEVTQLIYYTTFSVNFFLYALYGKHFQRSLILMFRSFSKKTGCNRNTRIERQFSVKTTLLTS